MIVGGPNTRTDYHVEDAEVKYFIVINQLKASQFLCLGVFLDAERRHGLKSC